MELIARRDVWPRITSLAEGVGGGQRLAAVAYLGAGAFDMLPMSVGDTLVVDCSPLTAAAGATSPAEVGRYLDAGVDVYRWDGLHAKVYVLGDTAVVGSANASGALEPGPR